MKSRYAACLQGNSSEQFIWMIAKKIERFHVWLFCLRSTQDRSPIKIVIMTILQLIFVPIIRPEFAIVEEFESTERGEGGFGSSGKR